jgi:hypothetical protein
MRQRRVPWSVARWVALTAILLSALAPTLSLALMGAPVSGWTEVCSASGSRWMPSEPARTDAPADPVLHGVGHCALCTTSWDGPGLPVDLAGTAWSATAGAGIRPAAPARTPGVTLHLLDARPRAPPVPA